eukprot:CFRG4482T1
MGQYSIKTLQRKLKVKDSTHSTKADIIPSQLNSHYINMDRVKVGNKRPKFVPQYLPFAKHDSLDNAIGFTLSEDSLHGEPRQKINMCEKAKEVLASSSENCALASSDGREHFDQFITVNSPSERRKVPSSTRFAARLIHHGKNRNREQIVPGCTRSAVMPESKSLPASSQAILPPASNWVSVKSRTNPDFVRNEQLSLPRYSPHPNVGSPHLRQNSHPEMCRKIGIDATIKSGCTANYQSNGSVKKDLFAPANNTHIHGAHNRRVHFMDRIFQAHTYSCEDYDRKSANTARSTDPIDQMRTYIDLMRYKLTEMLVHEDSLRNTNQHLNNLRGHDKDVMIRILWKILNEAANKQK